MTKELLDRIARLGTAKSVIADVDLQSPQTRDVDSTGYPAAHGMRSRSGEGDQVPAKTGDNGSQPVRNPTQNGPTSPRRFPW